MNGAMGVDCILVGFRDAARAVLSQRLGLNGNRLGLAETLERASLSGTASLMLWNIPNHLDRPTVAQALTATTACVLCVAPRGVGAAFCLKNGAADAMTRPGEVDEILARTERLLAKLGPTESITLGGVTVCLATGQVQRCSTADARGGSAEGSLRAAELCVLRYLAQAQEAYVPIQEIQTRALGAAGDGTAVRFHVKELRRKLGPGVIRTRRGFGYRLSSG